MVTTSIGVTTTPFTNEKNTTFYLFTISHITI